MNQLKLFHPVSFCVGHVRRTAKPGDGGSRAAAHRLRARRLTPKSTPNFFCQIFLKDSRKGVATPILLQSERARTPLSPRHDVSSGRSSASSARASMGEAPYVLTDCTQHAGRRARLDAPIAMRRTFVEPSRSRGGRRGRETLARATAATGTDAATYHQPISARSRRRPPPGRE